MKLLKNTIKNIRSKNNGNFPFTIIIVTPLALTTAVILEYLIYKYSGIRFAWDDIINRHIMKYILYLTILLVIFFYNMLEVVVNNHRKNKLEKIK